MTTPSPRPPALISVYSGRDVLGFIVGRGPAGFEAFGIDDRSLGIFPTMQSAADAISVAGSKGDAA
jgi:hypothetical protein